MNRKRIIKYLTEILLDENLLENNNICIQEIKKIVNNLLDLTKTNILNLNHKELKIMRLRFGILNNGGWQQFENIAKYLKMPKENIILFYKNALYKIKIHLVNIVEKETSKRLKLIIRN